MAGIKEAAALDMMGDKISQGVTVMKHSTVQQTLIDLIERLLMNLEELKEEKTQDEDLFLFCEKTICAKAEGPSVQEADLIEKVVGLVRPDVVLIVDSLAARNLERLSTTIQICDSGIEPGAGMGNRRKAISGETLGCKVVAIGVPTVIDSRTLIAEASEVIASWDEKATQRYMESRDLDMIVTSTDIDQIVKDFSDIISNAINITLHPGIYS